MVQTTLFVFATSDNLEKLYEVDTILHIEPECGNVSEKAVCRNYV